MSSNPSSVPSAPKPKAPPPRRAPQTNSAPAEDILSGPAVRKRATKTKNEEPLLGTMSVAFSAPVREVTSSRRPPPASSGTGGPSAIGRAVNKNVGIARPGMGLISDDDAYKNEYVDEELHYPPVTVPFQPPNDDTSAWYEQFTGPEFSGLDFSSDSPQLPAYRDPSYADQIDPKFSGQNDVKVELDREYGQGAGEGLVQDQGSVYYGLPLWQDPSKEVYMVPKLHSAGSVLTFKDEQEQAELVGLKKKQDVKEERTTTASISDNTSEGSSHLKRTANPNLSFIQLPPMLHLSSKEPSSRGLSQTDGIFIQEGSHPSYNVNGSTSKAEDVAKLGFLNRTRQLNHHGRVGELEIFESGTVYLVIGSQRFLVQKGAEVLMRQDLVNIKPHPFNPHQQQQQQQHQTTATTTTTTTTTATHGSLGSMASSSSTGDLLSNDQGLLHQTTIEQDYILYNMGHIDHHLIASIDIGDMIVNDSPH